jgi:hypothetical protein
MKTNSNDLLVVSSETPAVTYSWGGTITPAASATDILTINGSSSRTIRVKRISLSGIATSAVSIPISLIRRSTANGTGTFVYQQTVKHDINDVGYNVNLQQASVATTVLTINNDYQNGNGVVFSNVGSLTNVFVGVYYYVVSASATAFSLATTSGGAALALAGTIGTAALSTQATALITAYSANPGSLGTSAGTLRAAYIDLPLTGAIDNTVTWQFGDKNDKPLILRGTTDVLAVNLGGVTATGGSITADIQWEEDFSPAGV